MPDMLSDGGPPPDAQSDPAQKIELDQLVR